MFTVYFEDMLLRMTSIGYDFVHEELAYQLEYLTIGRQSVSKCKELRNCEINLCRVMSDAWVGELFDVATYHIVTTTESSYRIFTIHAQIRPNIRTWYTCVSVMKCKRKKHVYMRILHDDCHLYTVAHVIVQIHNMLGKFTIQCISPIFVLLYHSRIFQSPLKKASDKLFVMTCS